MYSNDNSEDLLWFCENGCILKLNNWYFHFKVVWFCFVFVKKFRKISVETNHCSKLPSLRFSKFKLVSFRIWYVNYRLHSFTHFRIFTPLNNLSNIYFHDCRLVSYKRQKLEHVIFLYRSLKSTLSFQLVTWDLLWPCKQHLTTSLQPINITSRFGLLKGSKLITFPSWQLPTFRLLNMFSRPPPVLMIYLPKVQNQNRIPWSRAFSLDLEILWRVTKVLPSEVSWSQGIWPICTKTSSKSLSAPSSEMGLHYFNVFVKLMLEVLFRWTPVANSKKLQVTLQISVHPKMISSIYLSSSLTEKADPIWLLLLRGRKWCVADCPKVNNSSMLPEINLVIYFLYQPLIHWSVSSGLTISKQRPVLLGYNPSHSGSEA